MPPRKTSSKPKKLTRKQEHRALLNSVRHRYDEMFESQAGGCAICGNPPKNRKLDIDHDHKRMYVRGLLCVSCNMKLGVLELEWMRKAVMYLEKGDQGWV